MRSFLSSRNRHAHDPVLMPAGEGRREPISTLGFPAGVVIGFLAVCTPGYAQTNGMPNSSGSGAVVQRSQTSAPAQRAKVIRTAPPAKIKITAQRVQPRATVQRAQSSAAVHRAQPKSTSSPTVGTHAAEKPTKPATSKTATPVSAPAKTAMPIPAPELLASPSQPDCTFDPARTDADDRQKLDYERQCYRHAEMIMRARLERLQGDVEEMIKAAKSAERLSASR